MRLTAKQIAPSASRRLTADPVLVPVPAAQSLGARGRAVWHRESDALVSDDGVPAITLCVVCGLQRRRVRVSSPEPAVP